MAKQQLFNRMHSLRLNPDELKNAVSVKLSDEVAEYLKDKGTGFPYDYFQKILRRRKLKPLENELFNNWRKQLPSDIHDGCKAHEDANCEDIEKNCFHLSKEFQMNYIIYGNQFAQLIENNKRILRNITKEKLAILFYSHAFKFENGYSYFQVGEMCRLLLKEGLSDVSDRLKQLEVKKALEVSNENLSRIQKEVLFNDDGFEDAEEFQKMFWESEKSNYLTKLQLEESKAYTFLDYFIKCINALQGEGSKLNCIANIKKGVNHEHPFRDIFKIMLSPIYSSVESEPEKSNGRIDLKINDDKLHFPIIIEFKGWWNTDKKEIANQLLGYLTDFEREGYIFMINHNKEKEILMNYKNYITEGKTGYLENSWKEETYKGTGFIYYSSSHKHNGQIKTINHFIFNANKY